MNSYQNRNFLNAGQFSQIKDRARHLSCRVGSARGTTRSISVRPEGEKGDFQPYAFA